MTRGTKRNFDEMGNDELIAYIGDTAQEGMDRDTLLTLAEEKARMSDF